ncbi:uncharacterized protein LOC143612391 [Bidens hawaiensis]|uniref:uncharacterized protein LOC143612391 n=1 Tax=Bidens hawaiensis TaxID=980011 RepID=UPI00404A958A
MTSVDLFYVRSMWRNYFFDFATVNARGKSGGIISIWDPSVFVKSKIFCFDNVLIVEGLWVKLKVSVYMVNVYAPQEESEKLILWEVPVGENGNRFSKVNASNFNSFIDRIGLFDMPLGGFKFTRVGFSGKKLSKLDRVLISEELLEVMPSLAATILPSGCSDHRPIMIQMKEGLDKVVEDAWKEEVVGRGLVKVKNKLKLLKERIKGWVKVNKEKSSKDKVRLEYKLIDCEHKIETGMIDEGVFEERNDLLLELEKLNHLENKEMAIKLKYKWSLEGDENSKFFNALLKKKRKQMNISGVKDKGEWIIDPLQVKQVFFDFYSKRFKPFDGVEVVRRSNKLKFLSPDDNDFLVSEVTMLEVKLAVWGCGSDKSPGPDGFSFAFIKKFWDIMKADFFEAVQQFFWKLPFQKVVTPLLLH